MRYRESSLAGCWIVEDEPILDERGSFARTFDAEEFAAHGLEPAVIQANLSYNRARGTLRGLHYQAEPHGEPKLVRCMRGAIFDVAVDLRADSPTHGRWHAEELTAANGRSLYIPAGMAHGFQTLRDDCDVLYLMGHRYVAEAARGVRWDDPAFAIEWPDRAVCGRSPSADRRLPGLRPRRGARRRRRRAYARVTTPDAIESSAAFAGRAADACPLCGGASSAAFVATDRNREVSEARFAYRRCRACGTVFLPEAPADLARYYADGYFDFAASGDANWRTSEFLRGVEAFRVALLRRYVSPRLAHRDRSGAGAFAAAAREAGFDVTAIEMDARCCEYLRDEVGVTVIRSDRAGRCARGPARGLRHRHVALARAPAQPRGGARGGRRELAGGGVLIGDPESAVAAVCVLRGRWAHLDAPRHLCLIPAPALTRRRRTSACSRSSCTTGDPAGRHWNRFGWEYAIRHHPACRPSTPARRRRAALTLLAPVESRGMNGGLNGRLHQAPGDVTPAGALPVRAPPEDVLSTSEAGPAAVRGGVLRIVGFAGGTASAGGGGAAAPPPRRRRSACYILALSLVAIVGGLSDLGLTAIGVREMSVRKGASRRRFAANLLAMRLVVNAVGLAFIIGFAVVANYGSQLVLGVALAGIGLVLQSLQGTLAVSLASRLRLGWVTVADLVRQTINALLIIALVAAGAGLVPALAAAIPASACALLLTVALVRGDMPLRPRLDWDAARELLPAIVPYSVGVAAATIYFRLAVVLVSLITSALASGYFNLSTRIIETLVAVPGLLAGAAFPIFSHAAQDNHDRLAYGVQRVFEVALLVGAATAVALVLGAPIAVRVIGGPRFAPSASILQIQAIGLTLSFVNAVWVYAMLSLGLTRDIMRINLGLMVVGGASWPRSPRPTARTAPRSPHQ